MSSLVVKGPAVACKLVRRPRMSCYTRAIWFIVGQCFEILKWKCLTHYHEQGWVGHEYKVFSVPIELIDVTSMIYKQASKIRNQSLQMKGFLKITMQFSFFTELNESFYVALFQWHPWWNTNRFEENTSFFNFISITLVRFYLLYEQLIWINFNFLIHIIQ